jgi:hypothetical protein
MKVLFLDIDGVVNCASTAQRHRGYIGIDPYMALLIDRIIQATGCKVVLSSSWRILPDGREEVRKQVCEFIDVTPSMPIIGGAEMGERGKEVKAWLEKHPEVTQYAILDDSTDFLPEQFHHFFRTYWEKGITEEIANAVIYWLNIEPTVYRFRIPDPDDCKGLKLNMDDEKGTVSAPICVRHNVSNCEDCTVTDD